jgi:hypothetical protein
VDEPTFDIFRGTIEQTAEWIESVLGLSNALDRMEEIAASVPDQYFVCRQQGQAVLSRLDTRKVPLWPERKPKIEIR